MRAAGWGLAMVAIASCCGCAHGVRHLEVYSPELYRINPDGTPIAITKTTEAVLLHKPGNGKSIPINFTFTYPDAGGSANLNVITKPPLVLLLNGASVEAAWYSQVIKDLAARGYVVAASDYYRHTYDIPGLPKPGCRPDWIYTSAALINTLYDFVLNQTRPVAGVQPDADFLFLRNADLEELVLLSHSLGGSIALTVATGKCNRDSREATSCEDYRPILDSQGRNVLKGVVAYEGFTPGSTVELPPGMWALYLTGQFNHGGAEAFNATSGGCSAYLKFDRMNHFGINNFNPNTSSAQVTPCAMHAAHDPYDFRTDAVTQNAGLNLLANVADAVITAQRSAPESAARIRAAKYLADVRRNPRVLGMASKAVCAF